MVVISEAKNMFWGVTIDGGKRYTQTVERSFHISMAALEVSAKKDAKSLDGPVAIMIQHDKAEFLMCTLDYNKLFQQPLDLEFAEGEEVTFFLNGKGVVHLTGFLLLDEDKNNEDFDTSEQEELSEADMTSSGEEDDDDDDNEVEDDEEDESEDDIPKLKSLDTDEDEEDSDDDEEEELSPGKKRKKQNNTPQKKQKLMEVDFDEEDEEDDDFSPDEDDDDDDDEEDQEAIEELLELEAETDSDDDDEEEAEEEADMSGSFLQTGKKSKDKSKKSPKTTPAESKKSPKTTPAASPSKKNKKDKKSPAPAEKEKAPEANGTPATEGKKKKKKKNKNKNKNKEDEAEKQGNGTPHVQAAVKRVLEGGIICEDQKTGGGPVATPGKMCHMTYTGKLQQNGKQFDSNAGGKPFRFKLGKGEVIKGWDIGVKGMKVGGKRKLIIPAAYGYGSQKVGSIPSNSSLVFDIELKAVS